MGPPARSTSLRTTSRATGGSATPSRRRQARPDPPGSLAATRGNRTVTLAWTPGHNGSYDITGYNIWRGSSPGTQTIVATTSNGANTSFVVNGLTNGETSFFTVTALNLLGQSASSNAVSAKPATVPLPPTITSIAEGNGTLTLSWAMQGPSPVDGGEPVTSYTLHEGTSPDVLSANGTFSGTSATLARPNGATRHYALTAKNAVGESALGNSVSGAAGAIPFPPGEVVATPANRTISLSWLAPSDDGGRAISHYVAYLGHPSQDTLGVTVESTSHTFEGLTNATTYTVWVTAVNSKGESNEALVLEATPVAPRPDPPAALVATRGNALVTLSWTPGHHDTPLLGYTIWRGTSSGATSIVATTSNGANTSFTLNGLANGVTQFFNVTARTAEGMSASSNEVSAKPATTPSPPVGIAIARENRSATLTWTTPADGGEPLLGFDVYRVDGGTTLLAQTSDATNTSFTVNGLVNGAPATFHVRARNLLGAGTPSSDVTTTPAGVPNPPQLLSAVRGNGTVTLTWANGATDGTPITGTRVLQAEGDGALIQVLTTTPATTTLVRSGLTNGETYTFALAHSSDVGVSGRSNMLGAKPARAPDAPRAFTATFGDERVKLAWVAPDDGGEPLTGYTISSGLSAGSLQPLATVDGANTSFVAMGLTNGATYHFRLTVANVVGTSPPTATLSAMPGRVPDAPRALVADAENAEVALSWAAPASDGGRALLGYTIQRAQDDGPFVDLDDIGTNTSYVAAGLANGATYRFTVVARNVLGASPASEAAAAMPLATPSAPTDVTATLLQPSITLAWGAPANEGGAPVQQYRIYASETPGGARWLVATVDSATFAFVDDAPPATLRHYVVRALNVAGLGPESDEATGATPADPLAPTLPELYRTCTRDATTQTAACTPGSAEAVIAAAAGARHTCALLASGRVDCYGDDGFGQSGDHLAGQPAIAVSAGGAHTCALLDNGNVDCWGNNGFGRAASYLGGDAIGVSAGGAHTCFLLLGGVATCQGADGYGQAAGPYGGVKAIAAGAYHTCFLLTAGDVECQGLNDRGQATGDTVGDAIAVSAGGFHACALSATGQVRCWGSIDPAPSEIQGIALEIASGQDHACALVVGGNVVCWGATRDGQSEGYAGGDAAGLIAGGWHGCAFTIDGALACWGAEGPSDHGQAEDYAGARSIATPDPLPTTIALVARDEEA